MVVITSAETLKNRKDVLWAALDAQREAIDLLESDPAKAAPLITSYFIKDEFVESRNQARFPLKR